MAIEIGSLVVKGQFGAVPRNGQDVRAETERQLAEMRRDILEDVRDMLSESARRSQDR